MAKAQRYGIKFPFNIVSELNTLLLPSNDYLKP